MAIDASVGGVDSNSYLTLVRASTLAQTIPHMETWITGTANREQLLIHATRLVDRYFSPAGEKASETQALKWPRKHVVDPHLGVLLSDSVIPTFVEMATIEWAGILFDTPDPNENVGHGLKRLETPSYRMEFDGNPPEMIPRVVSMLMSPYSLRVGGSFHRVVRV